MKKLICALLLMCLALTPVLASAEGDINSYFWIDDYELDLFDLGFAIIINEKWSVATQEELAAMNGYVLGEDGEVQSLDETRLNSALNPYVIASFLDEALNVRVNFCSEDIEDETLVASADKYLELMANDLVASGAETGVTYTYDPTTVSDAALRTQLFREMAVYGDDGTIYDLLVCQSGVGTYYTFVITGTAEGITAFAPDFVNAVVEIDAVG